MLELEVPNYKKIEILASTLPDCISFSQGTLKLEGTPTAVKEYIRSKLESDQFDYYQYVGGIYPLRAKIAATLSQKYGVTIDPEQILISHGAIGGITNLCLTLLKEGDDVMLAEPAYPSYRNIVRFSKASPRFVKCFSKVQGEWIFEEERIMEAVSPKTKMVILSNPSNPCGVGVPEKSLLALKKWCEEKGIYLLSDEVYDKFIYEGTFSSATPYAASSPFVIRLGSFSKDFAMSGWRIGYVVGSKELILRMTAVQDGTLCCPSVIGQHAALFALQNEHLIAPQVQAVRQNRDLVYDLLKPLMEKGHLSITKPKAGIFYFLKAPFKETETLVMDILQKVKVALVPGKDFGLTEETHSHIRLCFARKEAILKEGMRRILSYYGL